MAHVAQMLTQEPIYKSSSVFCFKPILISAHKLILLIYGDNMNAPRIPSMSMRLAMAESGIGDISAAHYAREGRCNGGERGAAREAAMESLQGR